MTSYLNGLTKKQKEFIYAEHHGAGRRYTLALIDTEEGAVIMDYPREIIQAYNCESVLIKNIKAGDKNPKKFYLLSDAEQKTIIEV